MKKFLLLLLMPLSVTRVAPLTGSVSDAALMQQLVKQSNVPGVSIAVIKDFKIALAVAYGLADVEAGTPVTTRTLFQAGSVSKTVAAMTSLKAVQEGRFSLDQDINTILNSFKLPVGDLTRSSPVTPRMLMSHTSGMGDGFGFPGYDPGTPLPTLQQMLDGVPPSNTRAVRLERAPMTAQEYSGGAVVLQQLALADAVGKPFAQIAREWVLDPLEMTNSTFEQPLPVARQGQAARAHNDKGARADIPWRVFPEQAAAGLWTTPTDLARFAIEVQLAVQGSSLACTLANCGAGDDHAGRRGRVRRWFQPLKAGRGLVFFAQRQHVWISERADRAPHQRIRRCHHDQRRLWRRPDSSALEIDRAGIQVGCPRSADTDTLRTGIEKRIVAGQSLLARAIT
jgi:CubicO group peptidase (beta-lactamase class C family)